MLFDDILKEAQQGLDALARGDHLGSIKLLNLVHRVLHDPEIQKQYWGSASTKIEEHDAIHILTIIFAHAYSGSSSEKIAAIEENMQLFISALKATPEVYNENQLKALVDFDHNKKTKFSARLAHHMEDILFAYYCAQRTPASVALPVSLEQKEIQPIALSTVPIEPSSLDKTNSSTCLLESREKLAYSTLEISLLTEYFDAATIRANAPTKEREEAKECLQLLRDDTKPIADRLSKFEKRIQENHKLHMIMATNTNETHPAASKLIASIAILEQIRKPLEQLASYYAKYNNTPKGDIVRSCLSSLDNQTHTPQERLSSIRNIKIPLLEQDPSWKEQRKIDPTFRTQAHE